MQNKTKNIFFKIISGLVLIQGVLQLLNLLGLVKDVFMSVLY